MSIYRGAGGSGDAVNDSSSEASLVQQLAIEAQADADAAQASATAAAGSASTASTQATNASNSATAASTSASNASTSATNAASSASAASTSASNASTSATNASNSATSASTSASTATTQAGIATTQASNASTSASNASSAQTAAEAARDATLTAYDNFDDRYLGSKTTDPTLDNDGNALLAGSLYFNSVSGAMKVYTGSVWVAAYVSGTDYLAKANNLSDLTNTATARTNLGVAIGTNVQAYDAQLADVAGLTPIDNGVIIGNGTNFVVESGATLKTSLGLTIGTDVQAWDADLDTWATKTAPSGTVVGTSDSQTLTTKTIALGSNTVSGTLAQFNTAVTDADLVSIAGTETLTNKTLTSPVVTGGSINNTPIGATTASTGAFSTLSATGVTTVQAGSVSAPAITTTGDTNTGIFFPAADTIAFTEGGAESMRIDSSGNLGVGTISPVEKITVAGALSVNTDLVLKEGTTSRGFIFGTSAGLHYRAASGLPHIFQNSGTELVRIDSSGNLLVGQTSQSNSEKFGVVSSNAGAAIYGRNTTANGFAAQFFNSNATGNNQVAYLQFSGQAPNNTTAGFLYCNDSSILRAHLYSNGGLANFSGNNVNLSDAREKTNIELAGSYLDKMCAIPVKTFNYINQNREEDDGLTLGVIAQDVQVVAPELITESNWGTEEEPKMRLSIYQTDLQYALMKCIQEQQALIENLTTRLNALEGK